MFLKIKNFTGSMSVIFVNCKLKLSTKEITSRGKISRQKFSIQIYSYKCLPHLRPPSHLSKEKPRKVFLVLGYYCFYPKTSHATSSKQKAGLSGAQMFVPTPGPATDQGFTVYCNGQIKRRNSCIRLKQSIV